MAEEDTPTQDTEKKESSSEESKQDSSPDTAKSNSTGGGLTTSEISALVEAEERASKERLDAAKTALKKAAEKEYEAAAAEVKETKTDDGFTNKRGQDVIFRREMGEPEFWLPKEKLTPPRPVLTQDEEQEISRKVAIPVDNTPKYKPQHILTPEFGGTTNYERGVAAFKSELEEKLSNLKNNPESTEKQIMQAEEDLKTLDYLYENYYQGMNVFRTAKNGRTNAEKK